MVKFKLININLSFEHYIAAVTENVIVPEHVPLTPLGTRTCQNVRSEMVVPDVVARSALTAVEVAERAVPAPYEKLDNEYCSFPTGIEPSGLTPPAQTKFVPANVKSIAVFPVFVVVTV